MKIVVTGNCQVAVIENILSVVLPDAEVSSHAFPFLDFASFTEDVAAADVWLRQPASSGHQELDWLAPDGDDAGRYSLPMTEAKVIAIPRITFAGFHPDIVYAKLRTGDVMRGVSDYHSAVGLWAWRRGLTPLEFTRLMSPELMDRLGYRQFWSVAARLMAEEFSSTDVSFLPFWRAVKRQGCFMHVLNHPSVRALASLVEGIIPLLPVRNNLDDTLESLRGATSVLGDPLADVVRWPVYPHIAEALGIPGSYWWRIGESIFPGLREWAEATWNAYGDVEPQDVICPRIDADGVGAVLEGSLSTLHT
mgnify:CR=1 FL=1